MLHVFRRTVQAAVLVLPAMLIACTDSSSSRASARVAGPPTAEVEPPGEPEPTGELEVARIAPLPEADARLVALGTTRYRTTFTIDGKERNVTTRRVLERVADDDATIVRIRQITEDTKGAGEDVIDLAADSLRPIRRRFVQPTSSAEIDYGSHLVSGVIKVAQREVAVRVELEAPAFGDGGALETAILAMPLTEGYRAPLRSVEAGLQQRVRFWSLEVVGREALEVPAGTFATFRIELQPLDDIGGGKTLWVSRETPRLLVQLENRLPAELGGAVTTTAMIETP